MNSDLLKFLAKFQAREVAGSRCALCSQPYDNTEDGLIFVGEVATDTRSVHQACWAGFQLVCDHMGLDWRAAVASHNAERIARKPPLGKRPISLQE